MNLTKYQQAYLDIVKNDMVVEQLIAKKINYYPGLECISEEKDCHFTNKFCHDCVFCTVTNEPFLNDVYILSRKLNVPEGVFLTKSRLREFTEYRFILFAILFHVRGLSYAEIGSLFKYHRTTITPGINAVFSQQTSQIRNNYEKIKNIVLRNNLFKGLK